MKQRLRFIEAYLEAFEDIIKRYLFLKAFLSVCEKYEQDPVKVVKEYFSKIFKPLLNVVFENTEQYYYPTKRIRGIFYNHSPPTVRYLVHV